MVASNLLLVRARIEERGLARPRFLEDAEDNHILKESIGFIYRLVLLLLGSGLLEK